tara:strand:- start:437 stop:1000 length:564 start_codon:yes stop_codon:yes gene_type:complete
MNNQNLIIYKFNPLYKILKEFDNQLNFKIIEVLDEISLNNKTKDLKNYLIVSKKKSLKNDNELVFEDLPIKLTVLMERLNVNLLKKQFNDQSEIMIGNYKIDLNSRLMSSNNLKLKLTEREVNTILYISKTSQPVSINELQTNVWEYQSDLETHTVETHIYRLRKKIFEIFNDKNFIKSSQNGYEIK